MNPFIFYVAMMPAFSKMNKPVNKPVNKPII